MTTTGRQHGNISIIAVAGVALAFALCLGVARVGGAVSLRARADSAADAAALAAGDSLALGHPSFVAEESARAAAADNGATYVTGVFDDDSAEVVVRIGRAKGHARAVVDFSREPVLAP